MANLEFCDTYNMVAYLQKLKGSEEFHQIVDFLNTIRIRYALTENPTIYVSLILQFWQTARTLDNGEMEITATIDGKVKVVTEASVRRHFKLEDFKCISILPTTDIFEQLAIMGSNKTTWEQFGSNIATALICLATNRTFNFSKMIFDGMVKNLDSKNKFLMSFIRQETKVPQPSSLTHTHVADEAASTGVDVRHRGAATTVTSLDVGQGSGNIDKTPSIPHDLPLLRVNTLGSDEGSMTLQELTVLCTTLSQKVESFEADLKQTKKVYGAAYTMLIIKVKKLRKTVKTSQARRKAKIVNEEVDLEDPSKQGKSLIEDIDQDAKVTLVTPTQIQLEEMFRLIRRRAVSTGSGRVSTASRMISIAEESVSTAGASMPVSTAGMVDKGKGIMEESGSDVTKTKRQQEQERLGLQTAELFEVTMRSIYDFVPIESEDGKAVPKLSKARSSKRDAEEELDQGSLRRKRLVKAQNQGIKMDDLVQLWSSVKERFSSTEPTDDKERMLCAKLLVEGDSEMDRESGSRDRPPMLATGRYPQWRSRFLRYIDTRPNVPKHTIVEIPMNMSPKNKAHFLAEKEAIHLILTRIGDEIYLTIDACQTAQEMWEVIERLQQGESLNIQDVKTNLFWKFGKFSSHDGETMESYYTRFYKQMNEMIRNNLTVTTMQVNVQFLQQLQPEWSRLARNANPLALVSITQANQDHTTKHQGKQIAKPITPSSETSSEEYNDPEQAQRDKDMQKNLALIAKYFKKIYKPTNNNLETSSISRNKNVDMTPRYKNDNHSGQFKNQKTVNVAGAKEKVGSPVVQQFGIQCFNCREFGHFAKECRKLKKVKDFAYHKEKMLVCKQAEQGVPLQAKQYDWLADTDEEVDEQELKAHYSYIEKIQEVPTADLGTDLELVEQVQNDAGYNVFANDLQHSEQSKSVSNTCLVETDDGNVIPDSPDMCEDIIQNDQNDVESDDERVALANLIANLKLDTKQTEFEKYKAFNDRTIDYDKLERKLNKGLGQLAQKHTVIKEGMKTKAYELSVVKEEHDELMKQSLLTNSHYEGLVKQKTKTKDLHTTDYTQLYDFLKYNQKDVDELKAERLAKTQDPLALMVNSNNPYAFPAPHQDQSSLNQNYLQQPMPNHEDITDPTTAMNMALALMAKAFKLNYSTPTNNNQRISSNPRNRQIAQPGNLAGYNDVIGNHVIQNAVPNLRVQNVRNHNGLIGVQGNGNQNQIGNGNLVATRAEGNATGQNGNQIRPRRRDAAYLQTLLLITQKEEAGIELQAEEYDLMAAAVDLDEIVEVNANCILMANLQQQVSTSGTQTDSAPIYNTDRSAEVHENCDDNEIFNMFTQEEQYTELLEPIPESHQVPQNDNDVISQDTSMEQGGETVEQHPVKFEETRALYDSLY
nr:hypothetical protein [Tanacetum cinerariifolium]